jgi:hypothetical protein
MRVHGRRRGEGGGSQDNSVQSPYSRPSANRDVSFYTMLPEGRILYYGTEREQLRRVIACTMCRGIICCAKDCTS